MQESYTGRTPERRMLRHCAAFWEIATLKQRCKHSPAAKKNYTRNLIAPIYKPVRGLMAFLDQARAMGIPMALATSAGQQNISLVLDGLGFRDYFAVVVGAEDIQNSKPHPEMFLTAARRLGILPQSCLVFEDSPVGIEAARRAGMRTVVITTFLDPKELQGAAGILQAVPDFTHREARRLIEFPNSRD